MREELEWISQNPKGRQAKSKARIGRYEDLLKASREKAPELGQVFIPPGPKISKLVIKAEDLTMTYGDKLLFENLSFKIEPGAIVGSCNAVPPPSFNPC
jgi:ATPase subunit of ABC transporter with duplicated ATPase domains